jgi:hypothetical protein
MWPRSSAALTLSSASARARGRSCSTARGRERLAHELAQPRVIGRVLAQHELTRAPVGEICAEPGRPPAAVRTPTGASRSTRSTSGIAGDLPDADRRPVDRIDAAQVVEHG